MTPEEMRAYRAAPVQDDPCLILGDLEDYADKATLVYGYDIDRATVHIYVEEDQFVVLRYRMDTLYDIIRTDELRQEHLPTKRAYLAACDFEACLTMKGKGLLLSFTSFTYHEPLESGFYGKTLNDFGPEIP